MGKPLHRRLRPKNPPPASASMNAYLRAKMREQGLARQMLGIGPVVYNAGALARVQFSA